MSDERWDDPLSCYLPVVDETDPGDDDCLLFPGRWVPSTNEHYWAVVHGDGSRVYATQSNPYYGPLMTSWCDGDGCPTVAAVSQVQGPHGLQPPQFYRWEPNAPAPTS